MKPKCDFCGRTFDARNIWKNQNEQFCSACATLKILELTYLGISPEVDEELVSLIREMEKLVDRQQGAQTLSLLKKGLMMINKMMLPDTLWTLFGGFTQYFNKGMEREGRIENIRFIKERSYIGRSLTFVVVVLYQKKKPLETWKFFVGTIPRPAA